MPIPMIQIKIPSFSSNAVHPSVNLPPATPKKVVIGLNVRRNQPQSSNFGLKVRSSNEPSRLYCSGSGRYEAKNGNLYCVFSTEKYFVIRKRGRHVEVVSKFHPKKFGVNVRRKGPESSICVRSFSPMTRKSWVPCRRKRSLSSKEGVFAYPPETVYSFRGDMQKPPIWSSSFWLH
jgi:hypothetical protein